jgi:hypothetical protein
MNLNGSITDDFFAGTLGALKRLLGGFLGAATIHDFIAGTLGARK